MSFVYIFIQFYLISWTCMSMLPDDFFDIWIMSAFSCGFTKMDLMRIHPTYMVKFVYEILTSFFVTRIKI